jgi:hypothetical protein
MKIELTFPQTNILKMLIMIIFKKSQRFLGLFRDSTLNPQLSTLNPQLEKALIISCNGLKT